MTQLHLRDEVRRAIGREWEAFERDHPHLARVLDQELLVEHAAKVIAADPEYCETMEQAQIVGTGMGAVADLVGRMVSRLLREIV